MDWPEGGVMMIVLDENRLSKDTLLRIGRDYEMEPDNEKISAYEALIDRVIDRFYFDVDEFKEKFVKIMMDGIKVHFNWQ